MGDILKNVLIPFIADTLKNLINFFTAPIYMFLKTLIPEFSAYFGTATAFITNYIFKGFQWIKMSFLNLTGLNHNLWVVASWTLAIALYLFLVLTFLRLAYNLWSTFHGTKKVS